MNREQNEKYSGYILKQMGKYVVKWGKMGKNGENWKGLKDYDFLNTGCISQMTQTSLR